MHNPEHLLLTAYCLLHTLVFVIRVRSRGSDPVICHLNFDRQVPSKPRLVGGVERPNGSRGPMGREAQWVKGHK